MSSPDPEADDLEYLERVVGRTEEIMRRLGEAHAMIGEVTGEGEAAGGMVRVVADGRGRVRAIELNPRVMRLDPVRLAQEAAAAMRAAQEAAARRTEEIVEGARAEVSALPEPLDETFVRRRVERVAREIE
jgi:DNA-binding protein YbaB